MSTPTGATDKTHRLPRLESSARASIPQRKKAGREVERAVVHQAERRAPPRKSSERGGRAGGKLSLGVSHRGIAGSRDGRGKKRGADKGRRRK